MLNIHIKTIPHKEQRYPTSGDYWREKHKVHVRISEMRHKDFEFLIAIHELIELYLTEKRKISWDKIDAFDKQFERERKEDPLAFVDDEPGDEPKAPYYHEHQFASGIERLLAAELGVNWKEYEDSFSDL